jgi:hypothetical protein
VPELFSHKLKKKARERKFHGIASLAFSSIYITHKGADNFVFICICIVLSVPLYRKIMSIGVGKKKEICITGHDKRCVILTSANDDTMMMMIMVRSLSLSILQLKCDDLIFRPNNSFFCVHLVVGVR